MVFGKSSLYYDGQLREPLILLLAGLVAFGASLGASFHFDDYALFSDPSVTSPSGWWQVWRPLQTRPLTYFTYWLNYRLGGKDPFGYHAVNLALHLGAALALWNALRRLVTARAACLAAALFAVHPIQAEAVAYVFARATLLMTLFCALSLGEWARGRPWRAAAWFLPAVLAKEECAAFPLFLLLLDCSVSRGAKRLLPAGAMLGLASAAGLRVIAALASVPQATAGFTSAVSPLQYLAAQGWVMLRYLRLALVPWGFNFDPDIRVSAWQAAGGWLIVTAVSVLAARRFRGAREGFWILGGFVLLLPSSSIFPAADFAADRRMYLPMAAFASAAGLVAQGWKPCLPAAAGVLLALLSFGRMQVWRTEESLWSEAVRLSPRKVRPKIQLSRVVAPQRALKLLDEAKLVAPGDPRVASELGRVWLQLSRPDRALAEFGRALAVTPRDPQALNNRGVALLALGQREAAREDFARALALDPCLAEARENLLGLGVRTEVPRRCR